MEPSLEALELTHLFSTSSATSVDINNKFQYRKYRQLTHQPGILHSSLRKGVSCPWQLRSACSHWSLLIIVMATSLKIIIIKTKSSATTKDYCYANGTYMKVKNKIKKTHFCPFSMATSRQFKPSWFNAATLAPFCIRISTTCTLPSLHARWRGVTYRGGSN